MSNVNVDRFKQRILEEKERLIADRNRLMNYSEEGLAEGVGELVDFDLNHPGDSATETFERQKDIALNQNIDGMLTQIDEALAKIDSGTYGKCDRCGRDIPTARLEALPYATLCVDCQARVEG
jgi:RNA polymerase-binding protein DksA